MENLTFETIVTAIVVFFSSTAGSTVLTLLITTLKNKRLNPEIIAKAVTENIEGATLKIAVSESIKEIFNPILEMQTKLTHYLEKIQELITSEASVNIVLADFYSKSDKLSDERRKQLLDAKTTIEGMILELKTKAEPLLSNGILQTSIKVAPALTKLDNSVIKNASLISID